MIGKFKKLETLVNESSKSGQEIDIEENEYKSLVATAERARKLLSDIHSCRYQGSLKVSWKSLISAPIDEVPMEERGLEKEIVESINSLLTRHKYGYTGNIDINIAIKIRNKLPKEVRNLIRLNEDNAGKSHPFIPILGKKPKGGIVIYRIQEDCSKFELMQALGCKNDEELTRNFRDATMNLYQVNYIKKREQRKKEAMGQKHIINSDDYRYTIFINLRGKVELLNILGENPYIGSMQQKGTKLLTFFPDPI